MWPKLRKNNQVSCNSLNKRKFKHLNKSEKEVFSRFFYNLKKIFRKEFNKH